MDSDIITLSVGGKEYQTTITTLTKEPGSMLSAMFSGRHQLIRDKQGRIFIDRDGKYFRTGEIIVPQNDVLLLTNLITEAQYFQLDDYAKAIEQTRSRAENLTMPYKDFLQLVNIHPQIQAPMCNLSGLKISYLDLTRANLQGTDFSLCTFYEVNLSFAKLQKCNFYASSITNSCLREAILDGSNCSDASFAGNDMRKASCRETNFTRAVLGGADLRGCDMHAANLTGANLLVANLAGAVLNFAILQGANLEGANTMGVRGYGEGSRSCRQITSPQ